jgi:hypothetical protein
MTSTTPTLTDRYVQAVLGGVPTGDRPELEREIRALIADTVDAKAADGTLDAGAAERAALTELGDPGALASRYTSSRADYLLGPNVYPVWLALVGRLLAVLVPLIGVLALTASLIEGSTPGQAIVAGISGAFQVAVQTLFWFTLVFVIIDRVGGPKERAELSAAAAAVGVRDTGDRPWTPDDLPDLPTLGRMDVGDLAAALVANVFLIAGLIWATAASPFVIDGQSYPLFDPALWSFWLPWFIVVAVLEIVFTLAVYRRGRWTYTYAVGNALLGAAFAIPAIYLLANQLLFNPAFVDALGDESGEWLQVTTLVTSLVIVGAVGWDAIDGFLKARRSATALGDAA